MAYFFQHDESLSSGIRRLSLELVDNILEQLKDESSNRNEAIHAARKSFKQLRAVLRLVRAETGEAFYQEMNSFYRDLALQLAPLRDAFMLIETLDKLEREDTKSFRASLMKEYRAIRRDLLKKGGVVSQVICQLEAMRPKIETWVLPSEKFRLIEAGLEQGYRQGRKWLKKAYKSPSDDSFHEFRKAVKILWYHCRLIAAASPEDLDPYVAELKQLSEILGEANDFAVLAAYCAEHGQMGLLHSIQEKRQALLNAVKPLGKALYKEESGKFMRKIKAAWKKWQALSA